MAATPMARPTMNRPRMRVVTSGAHPITTDPNVKRNDAPPITAPNHQNAHDTCDIHDTARTDALHE